MAACEFKINQKYDLKDKDILVFPYEDEKSPLFSSNQVPIFIEGVSPPEEQGKSMTFHAGRHKEKRFVAITVRLDDQNLTRVQSFKKHLSSIIRSAPDEKNKRVIVFLAKDKHNFIIPYMEAAVLGGYKFDKYLEKKVELPQALCITESQLARKEEKELDKKKELFSWVNFARDVLNEPPNVIHPESLASVFQKMGKKAGLKVTVWDERRLEKERCGGILAVGKGAASKPRLVIGEYKPRKPKGFLVFVGKGVTMDTGGYCLKPANSQIGMKYDMGGAAMTFAAACALASLKLPLRVAVIAPLVENDISSRAFHTQDIITMRNGKTVQVDNTDAEGRLILADALCIASEMKPDCIIDAATLTGACVVALGEDIAGLFGPDTELNNKLIKAAREADENLWEMPLFMPYMEQLKAEIADIKNIGSRWGGAITAALFLKQFVDEKIPWVHIDIAGPCVKEEPLGFLGKGAKGFGVKTLFEFANQILL